MFCFMPAHLNEIKCFISNYRACTLNENANFPVLRKFQVKRIIFVENGTKEILLCPT